MTPDRLIAEFDRISDAPDAVSHLRNFVYDLAVRGKLVPQDPRDEPAIRLLTRVSKQQESVPSIMRMKRGADAVQAGAAFRIPESWRWVRLIDLLVKFTDGTHHSPPNHPTGDFMYVTAKNIKPGGVSLDGITYIDAKDHQEIYARCDPRRGDILYIKDGATTGIVTINNLDQPFSLLSSVALLRLADGPFNRLIVIFLRSPFFYEQMRGFMKGAAITRLTLKRMAPALLPLPPTAEQHRIVAKVDELMALCEELETAQAKRERRRDRLAAASLARLNQPDDAREEFRRHACFHLNHLRRFTTRPDQIPSLRQTIVNLAVRGLLVPQDRQQSHLIGMPAHSSDYALPTNWTMPRLGDLLVEDSQNGYSRKPDDAIDGIPILRISAGTVRKDGVVAEEEHKLIGGVTQKHRQQYALRHGDLLACRFNGNRAFVGRLTIYLGYLLEQPIYPDKLIRLRLREDIANPRLVRLFAESTVIRRSIEAYCATTVGNWGISASNLKQVTIPLPPLQEQSRIVAKVDELIAICDQLETKLTTTETDRRRLLEAILHEALNAPRREPGAASEYRPLTLVALKFAANFPSWRKGGDRKRMVKSLAIAQRHLGLDFGWHDYQMSAGPHNPELIREMEADAAGLGLLEVEQQTGDFGVSYRYKATPMPQDAAKQLAQHFGDKLDELNRLTDLASRWTAEQSELYATTYAVWNDLIIDKKPATKDKIVAGVCDWSREKKEKFTAAQVTDAIAKLREMNLIPRGLGPRTRQRQHDLPASPFGADY